MKTTFSFILILLVLLLCSCISTEPATSGKPLDSTSAEIIESLPEGSSTFESDNVIEESSRAVSDTPVESDDPSDEEPSDESTEESSPEDLPGEQLGGRFGQYSTASEKDGMKILTIYSKDQISDFNARRNNGEWFALSEDDIDYIIRETISFFKEYSIIQIRTLDGNIHRYYGVPFYGTDEYYASFNGFDLGDPNAVYKLDGNVMSAIYQRIEVLNTAVFDSYEENCKLILADAPPMKEQDFEKIKEYHLSVYIRNGTSTPPIREQCALFHVKTNGALIEYVGNLSDVNSAEVVLLDEQLFPDTSGRFKYDCLEKNIVIEVWEEESKSMIARIRIDENRNKNEFEEILKRAKLINASPASVKDKGKYRVAVFFNGVSALFYGTQYQNFAFRYTPDGNIDLFSLNTGDYVFPTDIQDAKGISPLTEYINQILRERLIKED